MEQENIDEFSYDQTSSNNATVTLESLEQKVHELDFKLRRMTEERDSIVAENEELQEQLDMNNTASSLGSVRLNELKSEVSKLAEDVGRLEYTCSGQEHELKTLSDKMIDLSSIKETVKELTEDTKQFKEDFNRMRTHLNVAAKLELQTQEKMYESRLYHLENVLEEMRQREGHFMRLAEETAVLKDQVDALRELSVMSLRQDGQVPTTTSSSCYDRVNHLLLDAKECPKDPEGVDQLGSPESVDHHRHHLQATTLKVEDQGASRKDEALRHLSLVGSSALPQLLMSQLTSAAAQGSSSSTPFNIEEEFKAMELEQQEQKRSATTTPPPSRRSSNDLTPPDPSSSTEANNNNNDEDNGGREGDEDCNGLKAPLLTQGGEAKYDLGDLLDDEGPTVRISGTLTLTSRDALMSDLRKKDGSDTGCFPNFFASVWSNLFD